VKRDYSLAACFFFICLALAILLLVFSTLPNPAFQAYLEKPTQDECEAAIASRVHYLMNQERVSLGLAALALNPKVEDAAVEHSNDMAARTYFSHYSPEGNDFAWRYAEHGVSCAIAAGNPNWYGGGENIYQSDFHSNPCSDVEATAKDIVSSLLASEAHRRNALSSYWVSEGVGIAIAESGNVYATQDFC